jgi:hypothetical protein
MVVVVEEGPVSVFWSLEDDVSGMDMTGSSRLDGKDGVIRIGRSERVRSRVMGVASLSKARAVSPLSDRV